MTLSLSRMRQARPLRCQSDELGVRKFGFFPSPLRFSGTPRAPSPQQHGSRVGATAEVLSNESRAQNSKQGPLFLRLFFEGDSQMAAPRPRLGPYYPDGGHIIKGYWGSVTSSIDWCVKEGSKLDSPGTSTVLPPCRPAGGRRPAGRTVATEQSSS